MHIGAHPIAGVTLILRRAVTWAVRRASDEPLPYGWLRLPELIALGAEAFFEKPHELRDEDPAFYEQLSAFFRQDPAAAPS